MDASPVMVRITVECRHGSESVVEKIPRDRWDAMDRTDREKMLNEFAAEEANNHFGWGWHIDDPDDMAAVTD